MRTIWHAVEPAVVWLVGLAVLALVASVYLTPDGARLVGSLGSGLGGALAATASALAG